MLIVLEIVPGECHLGEDDYIDVLWFIGLGGEVLEVGSVGIIEEEFVALLDVGGLF